MIPSIKIFNPVLINNGLLFNDITRFVGSYNRDKSLQGGDNIAEIIIRDKPLSELTQWFNKLLGYEIKEGSAPYTWGGIIYEMDLCDGMTVRRISLDPMINRCKTTYVDENDAVQNSSWAQIDESVTKYGKKEEIFTLDGYKQTAAELHRDVMLKYYGWPPITVVDVAPNEDEIWLAITACGWSFTGNWQFITTTTGSEVNLSAWLSTIVSTDMQYITEGEIEANTIQVLSKVNTPQRAWDEIQQNVAIGFADYSLARAWVTRDRRFFYGKISTEPTFFMRGGILHTSAGGKVEINPWMLEPGIMRIVDYGIDTKLYGSWLQSQRDILIDKLSVDSDGNVRLFTGDYELSGLLDARYRNTQEINAEKEQPTSSGSSGKKHKPIWQLLGYTKGEYRRLKKAGKWKSIRIKAQRRKRKTGRFKGKGYRKGMFE